MATGILEIRWSGVGIDEWWRNEQFWVIGGVSAHLLAVFQGLVKVVFRVDTNFTVTSKASDENGDSAELYKIKWTFLLVPPTTLFIFNLIGVVAGVSYAVNAGYRSSGPIFGKLFFAFWVSFISSLSLKVLWDARIEYQPLLCSGRSCLQLFSLCYGFVLIRLPQESLVLKLRSVELDATTIIGLLCNYNCRRFYIWLCIF